MTNRNSNTIKIDTHKLELIIVAFQNAVTDSLKLLGNASYKNYNNFEGALKQIVKQSINVSSTQLREFHETSLKKMNQEVIKYETIINGHLTRIEHSKLGVQTEQSGHAVEEKQQQHSESKKQLIAEQRKAFTDFKDALKLVANRLLTVSGMFDKADDLQDRKNYSDYIGMSFVDLSTLISMGKVNNGVNEVYMRDASKNMMQLYNNRNQKDFVDNDLIKSLSKLKGQEHLAEDLKKAANPMVFIQRLMEAISKNKDDKEVKKGIESNITTDYSTIAFLQSSGLFHQDNKGFNLFDWAKGNAEIVTNNLTDNLNVSANNSRKKEDHDATKVASIGQSAPVLNTWNNSWSHIMEQYPEISKTFLSIGALGSALDDIVSVAKPLIGGLVAMKLSTMAFSLSTTSLSKLMGNIGIRLAPLALEALPFAVPVITSYMASTTAVKNTAHNVNGQLGGGVVVPNALTDNEKEEWRRKREERIQKDYKEHAQDIAMVEQNMNGQKLSFDNNLNEYVYTDSKTNKITRMGMNLPAVGVASDEMRANTDKIQQYQQKTGTKIIMRPKAGGMFSAPSIEFVAIDADGNTVANFGRKLKMPQQDMVDLTQKGPYKRLQKQGSLSTVAQVYPPPSTPETVRSLVKKDPSVNQGLSMDMNKIKEQMSTSMQLSRQLLNTPSTMQQRFNFYFTLPQNSSGRIEHSFDNNSVVSRKGGGSIANVDKAFPNFGAKGTAI